MAKPSGRGIASTPAAPTSTSPTTAASRPSSPRSTLDRLNLDNPLVVSSPRQRALATAELAGLTVDEVSPLLAEWDYGDYEGLTTHEIRTETPGWLLWTYGCPGGESVDQVSMRADQAVAYALEHMVDRDVVFVGHGHFSRSVVTRWVEQPLREGVAVRVRRGFGRGVRLRVRPAPALGAGADQPPRAGHRDVTAQTSFVLSGPAGTVVADGIQTGYDDVAARAGGAGRRIAPTGGRRAAVRHPRHGPLC